MHEAGIQFYDFSQCIVFLASRSKACTASSRCSVLVFSAGLWLRPASDWVNIITTGMPARATSAASCSGPEGSRWDVPAVSRIAWSQSSMSCGSNGMGSMLQILDHSTVQPSSAAKRSLAARASANIEASTPASRSRMSSVVSQRPTTAVTMPGKVLTLPMVATASGCLRAMGRISSASLAAAASASRRTAIGVDPECASCPWKVIAWRSTPLVPSTTPSGSCMAFENGSLLDMQFQIGAGMAALDGGVPDAVDVDVALAQRVFQADSVAVGAAAVGLDGVRSGKGGGAEEAAAEARAFLVGPIHQANGDGRLAVEVLRQTAQHLEAGEDAKAAVEPAAVGDGVQMTAEDEGAIGVAAQRRPGVPGGVEVVLHRQLGQLALKPGSRLEPGFAPGDALRSMIVRGQRAKLLEIGNGSAWV